MTPPPPEMFKMTVDPLKVCQVYRQVAVPPNATHYTPLFRLLNVRLQRQWGTFGLSIGLGSCLKPTCPSFNPAPHKARTH